MDVKKRSGEKRGGVKFAGLGGGGGLLLVVGGALAAATVWSVCEFRRHRKPSSKKGTSKDFQEKVKNVDDGGVGVRVILQNSKLLVDGSLTEEKVALNLPLDVEKRSNLEIIEEGEEEIQESTKIEEDGLNDENMDLSHKQDVVTCEVVHEKMNECVAFRDDLTNADTFSFVSENELVVSQDDGIVLDKKMELMQFVLPEIVTDDGIMCEKKKDEVVQFMTLNTNVDDGSNDAVSEDLDYEGEDGSEGSSKETSDSSTESASEEPWQVESSEARSQATRDEKNLISIQNKKVEIEESQKFSSANGFYHKDNSGNMSIQKERLGTTSKDQIMMAQGNSTNIKIWVSRVLLALLVLFGALIAQHKQFSPALADHLSSLKTFLMK